jgi:hypothetical protein
MFEPVIDDEEIRAVVKSKQAKGIFTSGKSEIDVEYNSTKYKFTKNRDLPTCSFIKRGKQEPYPIYTIPYVYNEKIWVKNSDGTCLTYTIKKETKRSWWSGGKRKTNKSKSKSKSKKSKTYKK